ncbi:MAG: hypothetical protein H6629_15735 [Calditrichae bacterium]|nr:hypothetical protein [Calditrichia bacterium]
MKPNKKGQKVNKTINKFEFNGPIQNSNLSLQSNKASQQNISNMNNTEIMEKILELINQDKSISKANKEELKFDIDIINREMKKKIIHV